MFFPFKYKLIFFTLVILLLVLLGSFFVVEHYIEKEFIKRIQVKLTETERIIQRLMHNRQRQLEDYSYALSGNHLILTMVRERGLDRQTRDDILDDEILFNFPDVDVVLVSSADGNLLAVSQGGEAIARVLPDTKFWDNSLEGNEFFGYINSQSNCYQMIEQPFYDVGEMSHSVFVAKELNAAFLNEIKRLSGVDIVFLRDGKPFLSTDWNKNPSLLTAVLDSFSKYLQHHRDIESGVIKRSYFEGEQYLFTLVMSDVAVIPPYALVLSLDRELKFVETIRHWIIITGAVAAALTVFLSFLFALGVSRPIKRLQKGTRAVEAGDLKHLVQVHTHDEFFNLAASFNHMIAGLAEKERIRTVMDKVVSKELAHELLKGDIQLEGEERVLTVLFSDIRDFSSLSEGMAPKDVLKFLNQYFTEVNRCIVNHQGVLDKYIAAAVMALFGAPLSLQYQASASVQAALDMVTAVNDFDQHALSDKGRVLKFGVGINTGTVVTGNMGAESHLNYTAIGDEVNLASRLEGLSKFYGVKIVISESTYLAVLEEADPSKNFSFRELDRLLLKGKNEGVSIYEAMEQYDPDLIRCYQEAVTLLWEGDFEKSYHLFAGMRTLFPADGPTETLYQRTLRYVEQPDLYQMEAPNGFFLGTEK